ncbi:hypothetical protein AAKU55_005587, partial [Oxalobacteraceae bacterium GrIS 1.11]
MYFLDRVQSPHNTQRGIVNGVWQREAGSASVTNQRTGRTSTTRRGVNKSGALKLLIRFGDALPVKKHLGYRARARTIINANIDSEMSRGGGAGPGGAPGGVGGGGR